jgi:glutamate decarboxylase
MDDKGKLLQQIEALKAEVKSLKDKENDTYYFSENAKTSMLLDEIPHSGVTAKTAESIIVNARELDFSQKLNTSSYVNVVFEEQEEKIALMGLRVNLADQTVYPHSYQIHDKVVNMLANLWHCPKPDDFDEYGVFAGAGTVGSTEACLLSGLALKFRWRDWISKRKNLTADQVLGLRPNLIISTCYQAAWEKLFKYMDIEPRFVPPKSTTFTIDPAKIHELVDENTIGVVCIMGNHYGGQYDPVWEVNDAIEEINQQHGFQLGIHIDGASGGFVAPFQKELPAWDFRLKNVLSISTSGHKYGESSCGTGWVVWRQRKDLSEHIAISVTYLGGKADSYTLNFSRPASGVYVQYYKLIRFGTDGYQQSVDNMMDNAEFIRQGMRKMTYKGKQRFIFLDDGDKNCLPVVTAMLNPECEFSYDDIDFQHVVSQHHWYISGYKMNFLHPLTEEPLPLFTDQDPQQTMFRIVVKNNLTRSLAIDLLESIEKSFDFMDSIDFSKIHEFDFKHLRHKDRRHITNHC